MADVLTPEQRSRCMAAIRGKDTKPELVVRSLLHGLGFRFRLHRRDLPGRPDIVLPKHKAAIFVHGCFWHMHTCKYGQVTPKTNTEFWKAKRLSNVARDARNVAGLVEQGFRPIVVWECETRDAVALARHLTKRLSGSRS